jgi:hypothetical protein
MKLPEMVRAQVIATRVDTGKKYRPFRFVSGASG